jgi:hypothetical protein
VATTFWDSKNIIYQDFLSGKKTINVHYYSTLLKEKLKLVICSKRSKRQDSVCLLQDNAYAHIATLRMATVLQLKWDLLPHPQYSPDLAPSGYHLFGPMKEFLGGKRFQNNDVALRTLTHVHCSQRGLR